MRRPPFHGRTRTVVYRVRECRVRRLSGGHPDPEAPTPMRAIIRTGIACATALSVGSVSVLAQNPVVWSASGPSGPVARGTVMVVHLTARIDGGWHVYSLTQPPGGPVPARISVAPDQPFTLAQPIVGPTVDKRFDPNFGINVETYDAQATFAVPIRIAPSAPRGHTSVALTARFQTCNATLCLPPRTERLTVPITMAAAGGPAVAPGG